MDALRNSELFEPLLFAVGVMFGEKGIGRSLVEYKLLQTLKQRMGTKEDQSGILHAIKLGLERRIDSQ